MADGAPEFAPTASGVPLLGVAVSLSGRRWRLREAPTATVRALQQGFGLIEPVARSLAARGVGPEGAADFLKPTLRALFPDPSQFKGMDEAAKLLTDAALDGRRTVVFADYDVDGAASAALLVRWFRALGSDLCIYVPDRMKEGYGPSAAAFERLKAHGAELVVTVDCGAAAHDALAAADAMGLPVVVIDHHLMRPGEAPPCAALVNPNQPGCPSGQTDLAAAGVCFVLLVALNREARRRGAFCDRPEPDVKAWLDLAAMGAVCDVTRLLGFNRALTAQGLKVMSRWGNPGLKALLDVAGAEGPASVFHAGFILGPRINAGGRIGRSDLGARLLSSDDPEEAMALAHELDGLNASRKEVERVALEAAKRKIERESNLSPEDGVIVVAGEDWHPGVVGIVAGRLRELYRKPVIVIGVDPITGVGKGSGRSQPGVNLGRAVQEAYDAGLLMAGGGHAMAAGLTVRAALVPDLRAFLRQRLDGEMEEATAQDALDVDALSAPGQGGRALYDAYQALAPFGPGAPEPTFAVPDVKVEQVRPMRGGHLRCVLADQSGAKLRAVAWRSEDTPLGRRLLEGGGTLHVAGKFKADDWTGRRAVELDIEDAADPRRAENFLR